MKEELRNDKKKTKKKTKNLLNNWWNNKIEIYDDEFLPLSL